MADVKVREVERGEAQSERRLGGQESRGRGFVGGREGADLVDQGAGRELEAGAAGAGILQHGRQLVRPGQGCRNPVALRQQCRHLPYDTAPIACSVGCQHPMPPHGRWHVHPAT